MAKACIAESRGHAQKAPMYNTQKQTPIGLVLGLACMVMSCSSINALTHTNRNSYSYSNQNNFIVKPTQFHYHTMSSTPKYIINAHCNGETYESDVYEFSF